MKMYYIAYQGQSFREQYDRRLTLRSAKIRATKRLEYGMSATIFNDKEEPIFRKEFWSCSGSGRFGWNNWEKI